MTECGLRERKKQRTREALTDAAFGLFQRKGFDATTIDEIAEAVDVSPRTFFRYFTSKEDVVLSLLDQQLGAVLEALAARPAAEPVLAALRHALVEIVRACETGDAGFDQARFLCVQQLMASSPALMAAAMEQGSARLDELARLVGDRMGVVHTVDPRPYLVASVTVCAVQTTVAAWREHDDGRPTSELIGQAFDLLAGGLDYPAAVAARELATA
jgi:AcrR family transcriptional regulator